MRYLTWYTRSSPGQPPPSCNRRSPTIGVKALLSGDCARFCPRNDEQKRHANDVGSGLFGGGAGGGGSRAQKVYWAALVTAVSNCSATAAPHARIGSCDEPCLRHCGILRSLEVAVNPRQGASV